MSLRPRIKRAGRGSASQRRRVRPFKKTGPLVTIITVCRNAAADIAGAMESVLRQSFKNLEYVVIDGGSTDGTIGLLRSFETNFRGRMRWISEPDAGIYDAMNKGIALARGTVIGILNSDDWYEPDAVAQIVRSFDAHGDGVYYGILRVHNAGQVEMLKSVHPRFLYRDVVGHPAYFVTRNIYETYGVFDLRYRYAADYDLMLRLYAAGVSFWAIEQIVANYQQGGTSTRHGVESLIESLRIRHAFGYLTKAQLALRIFKYRSIDLARRLRVKP